MNKSHVLSVPHGFWGKACSAGNVGHLVKERNAVHRARVARPSGVNGAHADGVTAFGKVTYIAGKLRLASPRAIGSELLRLVQRLPS
jgi:hypothetical protein